MELKGEDAAEILPLVKEGLRQTFEDFDETSPGDNVLIFEEPELFHILARLYARLGKIHEAIRISIVEYYIL